MHALFVWPGCPLSGHLQIQITSLATVTFDNALGSLDLPISRSLTALRINWPQARDREAGGLGLATCLDLRQSLQ